MGGTFDNRSENVEALLSKQAWHEERKLLRSIVLSTPLTEEVKWSKLCYTLDGKAVAMIYGLKRYCALGFFKGALLSDKKGLLHKPGENSQAMRWFKFDSAAGIRAHRATLQRYLREAIDNERAGLSIDFKEKTELVFPDELLQAFAEDQRLETAFLALTPGRQRGYNLHFSQAKHSATRRSRIDKSLAKILAGKGRNDR